MKNAPTSVGAFFVCAAGENRTRMTFRSGDFKSPVSTSSTTAAFLWKTCGYIVENEVRSGVEPLYRVLQTLA